MDLVKFCDKLLQLRRARKLTQKEVAAACGITRQTYSGYESGDRYPKKKETYQVLADFFDVSFAYLYTDDEMFIEAAGEQYGSRGMAQARDLVSRLAGMFAGGELSDQDREAVMLSGACLLAGQRGQQEVYTEKISEMRVLRWEVTGRDEFATALSEGAASESKVGSTGYAGTCNRIGHSCRVFR